MDHLYSLCFLQCIHFFRHSCPPLTKTSAHALCFSARTRSTHCFLQSKYQLVWSVHWKVAFFQLHSHAQVFKCSRWSEVCVSPKSDCSSFLKKLAPLGIHLVAIQGTNTRGWTLYRRYVWIAWLYSELPLAPDSSSVLRVLKYMSFLHLTFVVEISDILCFCRASCANEAHDTFFLVSGWWLHGFSLSQRCCRPTSSGNVSQWLLHS